MLEFHETSVSQSRSKFIIIFLILFFSAGIILVLVFTRKNDDSKEALVSVETAQRAASEITAVRDDYYLFSEPKYIELRQISKLPVEIGQVGRENPFLPYGKGEEQNSNEEDESPRENESPDTRETTPELLETNSQESEEENNTEEIQAPPPFGTK